MFTFSNRLFCQENLYNQQEEYLLFQNEKEFIDNKWEKLISPYLLEELWNEKNAYDACHFLMVPLHYTFQEREKVYMEDFRNQFRKFLKSNKPLTVENQRLNILHYYYLISQYLVLEKEYGKYEEEQKELTNYLIDEIKKIWLELPAWQWSRKPFKNMKERIEWKLENKEVEYSYYRAIIDEELFVFAIAADLSQLVENETLKDIQKIAYNCFLQESIFEDEGWILQKNVWKDHPDYAYTYYTVKEDIENKKMTENVSEDSSHSHRYALWINSLKNSHPLGTKENKFYSKVLLAWRNQFFNKIIVFPNKNFKYYRTNNFIDGSNGIYRWKYTTQNNNGYGPYELSGTLLVGWWTFLGEEEIKVIYRNIYEQFPLEDGIIDLYIGPNTTRERNIFIKDPESYYNGYKQLLVLLASKIK